MRRRLDQNAQHRAPDPAAAGAAVRLAVRGPLRRTSDRGRPHSARAILPGCARLAKSVETIVLQIRLPRAIMAMFVGAGLSISGAAFQGMFRNPLVSTDILGVTAASGFGAAVALLLSSKCARAAAHLLRLRARGRRADLSARADIPDHARVDAGAVRRRGGGILQRPVERREVPCRPGVEAPGHYLLAAGQPQCRFGQGTYHGAAAHRRGQRGAAARALEAQRARHGRGGGALARRRDRIG